MVERQRVYNRNRGMSTFIRKKRCQDNELGRFNSEEVEI